jgi:hypothetical protein
MIPNIGTKIYIKIGIYKDLTVIVFYNIAANARVYEPLRCQCAYISRYTKVTKRADLSKPAASNGLYTLL